MSYFGFLARFVVLPLVALRLLNWANKRHGKTLPSTLTSWGEDQVLLAHAVVAVTYTTIWDNYLVASGVWGYDRKLVSGLTIGWVPIEEYTFFVLQPLLTGSWLQLLMRQLPVDDAPYTPDPRPRLLVTGALGLVWAAAVAALLSGNPRQKYLSLIVGWALPPIMLQVAFGGDILWRHRALIAASILPASAYLGFADSRAIDAGTWRINPKNTIGVEVIPNLPLEEALFFLLTNTLLVFGVTLVQAKASDSRLPAGLQQRYHAFKSRITSRNEL
ncbi:MAG: lycopene cyclase domain-containing protein [Armatimonadetes bacterium]|nr:lycopene cyclase domain-containing protein [Anaerolineae bacterium]